MASCLGECGIHCHSRFDPGCLQCALHSLRSIPSSILLISHSFGAKHCAIFQQNPIVVTTQLDAPMDSDAVIAAAWSSIHLEKPFFSVCRDRVALRRNPTRSIASRYPIAENHEKSMVFIEFLDDATRSSQTEKNIPSKCIEGSAANFIAPEHAWATNGEGAKIPSRTQKQPYYFFFFFT